MIVKMTESNIRNGRFFEIILILNRNDVKSLTGSEQWIKSHFGIVSPLSQRQTVMAESAPFFGHPIQVICHLAEESDVEYNALVLSIEVSNALEVLAQYGWENLINSFSNAGKSKVFDLLLMGYEVYMDYLIYTTSIRDLFQLKNNFLLFFEGDNLIVNQLLSKDGLD